MIEGPRALPDFVIVGAQKGGRTSLYKYLQHHPQVLTATRKEVHFFDENYQRRLGPTIMAYCDALFTHALL
jgi:hypothetical protein